MEGSKSNNMVDFPMEDETETYHNKSFVNKCKYKNILISFHFQSSHLHLSIKQPILSVLGSKKSIITPQSSHKIYLL